MVLASSETSSRKPVAATSPRAGELGAHQPGDRSPLPGVARQMAFSADCSSPKTPLAVSSRVTTPMSVAMLPEVRLPAP